VCNNTDRYEWRITSAANYGLAPTIGSGVQYVRIVTGSPNRACAPLPIVRKPMAPPGRAG
jgi:hypothetical protein